MSTIGDLCVTSSVSSDDKLPIWQNANGVTRALPISVLDGRYLSQADVALLAASAKVETFVAGIGFTPGVSLALTLANQYFSAANIEVFFDAAFQGPDQYSLVGFGLVFSSPIPVGVQNVYVRGGATRVIGTPSDGTVTDSSVASGTLLYSRTHNSVWVTDPPYNAVPGGSLDCTSPFQAALNHLNSIGGGELFIPAGNWLTGPLTTYPNISIRGAGKFVTNLIPKAGSITIISLVNSNIARAGVCVRDLNIACGSVANVTGIKFTLCSATDIIDVAFSGCQMNFDIDRGFHHNIINCESLQTTANKAGTARLWSSVDVVSGGVGPYIFYATVWNYKIFANEFYLPGGGRGCVGPGLFIRRAVGTMVNLYANDLNFGGAVNGVVFENDCQGCKMFECEIGASAGAVVSQQGSGVVASPSFMTIENCDFDQPQSANIAITSGSYITIKSGFQTSSGAVTTIPSISLQNVSNVLIEGVQVQGFNAAGGTAVALTNTSNVRINGLRSDQNTNGVVFNGAGNTNIAVENCDFTNTTNPIGGTSGFQSAAGVGNIVRNNRSANPGTVASPAVPASGTPYTNNLGYPCRVFIAGGTVSGVAINGTVIASSGNVGIFTVNPGESVTLTYSVAPGWAWLAM